jgi:hypothetical protein
VEFAEQFAILRELTGLIESFKLFAGASDPNPANYALLTL